jgi:hypothetical protein
MDIALLLLRDSNLALQLHPSNPLYLGTESLQVIKSPFNRLSTREEQEEYSEAENDVHTTKSKVLAYFRWIFHLRYTVKHVLRKNIFRLRLHSTFFLGYNKPNSAYLLISPFLG